jgi:Alkaline phosphatase
MLKIISTAVALSALGWLSPGGAPALTIYPIDRAQILAGSHFDLKVEFDGVLAPERASVTVNGQPLAAAFGRGVQFVYSHPLDWERAVMDTIMLDRAVEVAKAFAAPRGDTLVLVTADHNHGLSIVGVVDDDAKGAEWRDKVGVYEAAGFPNYPLPNGDGYSSRLDVSRRLAIFFAGFPDYYETSRPKLDDPFVPRGARSGQDLRGQSPVPRRPRGDASRGEPPPQFEHRGAHRRGRGAHRLRARFRSDHRLPRQHRRVPHHGRVARARASEAVTRRDFLAAAVAAPAVAIHPAVRQWGG